MSNPMDDAVAAFRDEQDRTPGDASLGRARLLRAAQRRRERMRALLAAAVVAALVGTNSTTWAWSTGRLDPLLHWLGASDEGPARAAPHAPARAAAEQAPEEVRVQEGEPAPGAALALDDADEARAQQAPPAPGAALALDDVDEAHAQQAPPAPGAALALDDVDEAHAQQAPPTPVSSGAHATPAPHTFDRVAEARSPRIEEQAPTDTRQARAETRRTQAARGAAHVRASGTTAPNGVALLEAATVEGAESDSPSSTNAPSPPDERSTAQARTDDDLAAALRALDPPPPAVDADRRAFARAHRIHFGGGSPEQALPAWDRYLSQFPRGRFVPEARFNRAVSLLRLRRDDEARAALTPFANGAYGGVRARDARALLDALDEGRLRR